MEIIYDEYIRNHIPKRSNNDNYYVVSYKKEFERCPLEKWSTNWQEDPSFWEKYDELTKSERKSIPK